MLAVSHADCEDLADRIRSALAGKGELRGPALCGPGWGPEPRSYSAGDRVLLHANVDPNRRVFNGATGTILAVNAAGAEVILDDGAAQFSLGRGGRWDQARRHTRTSLMPGRAPSKAPKAGRGPKCTCSAPLPSTSCPAMSDSLAAANPPTPGTPSPTPTIPNPCWPISAPPRRSSPTACAAPSPRRSRPTTTPGSSTGHCAHERAEHAAVIATRPPDDSAQLVTARRQADHAAQEHQWATQGLVLRQRERAQLGTLHRLRRGGRGDIERADQALVAAQTRVDSATAMQRVTHAKVDELERSVAARADWDHEHGWRITRVADIDSAA